MSTPWIIGLSLLAVLLLFKLSRRHRRRRWRRSMLHGVARRLKLRPEQKELLRGELETLRAAVRERRGLLRQGRADLGALLAEEVLDDSALDATLRRPEQALAELRAEVGAALTRVHAALDPEQRQRLATLLAKAGPGHRRWRHA